MGRYAHGPHMMRRKAILLLSVTAAVLISGTAVSFLVRHTMAPGKAVPVRPLPLDADSLVKDFRLSHEFPGGSLTMTGTRVVRRGQKFLAVRSTIMKTNFFDNISGTYRDKKNKVEFAADKAEWDLVLDKPLSLEGVRQLTMNETTIRDIRRAKINFGKHLVTVYGEKTETYLLKQ